MTVSGDSTALSALQLPRELVEDIQTAGYYPELVADVVKAALGSEAIRSHFVHPETTFDQEAVRRHVTVMALTDTRLVIAHADDHEPGDRSAPPSVTEEGATATSECIPLRCVRGVMLTHVVPKPASYKPGSLGRELTLTIGWGAVSRVDLLPAQCGDPECAADHGYEGTVAADDIAVRVSADAEGRKALDQVLEFARMLSEAVGTERC